MWILEIAYRQSLNTVTDTFEDCTIFPGASSALPLRVCATLVSEAVFN